MFKKITQSLKNIVRGIVNTVKTMILDLYNNLESVIILTAATLGITALLTELPFMIVLPLWIETPMVIPVLATLTVMVLIWSMEARQARRA